ncbi:MAG: nitroreductase family protein [Acholeplasma sp.]|nr:nitroreductase family protein [Acholeplasma sp.]
MQTNNDFKDILLNRRSIRKYKTELSVDDTVIKTIFNEALRAPSANNLQPWSFKVIKSNEAKEKYSHLFPWNRSQYETSAFMVVILVDTRFASRASLIYDKQVSNGTMSQDVRDRQLNAFKESSISDLDVIKTAYLDAGFIAMTLMLNARAHGLDTCPIGGFDKVNAPTAFGLDHHEAVMALSFGVKDDEGYPSLRLDFSEVATIE